MIKITEEQINKLAPYIPNINELITAETDDDLLLILDDLILSEYDEEQDFLSKKGIELQHLFDEIYAQND